MEKDKVLQMRTDEQFLAKLDDWRRKQPSIPPRAEAIRTLVLKALEMEEPKAA